MGKTSWQTKKRYNDKAYTQFNFRIPKEVGDPFKEYCKEHGLSMNGLITEWIRDFLSDIYPEYYE